MTTPDNTTTNHEYQLWSDGQEDWEHRTDMSALDIDVEVRDTEANLSNYTPQSGAKFLATDTGAVFTGDGNSWNGLSKAKLGRVYQAEPGELQSVLNDAATDNGNYFFGGWPVVEMTRGLQYTNPPYTIPEPVVLSMNGAEIGTNQQVNLLEPDPGATIVGPGFLRVNTDPYTESALYLDASKGKISPKGGGTPINAFGHFHIEGPDQPAPGDQTDLESNGIYLDASSDETITNIHLGNWTIKQMHNCVLANTNDGASGLGFVNNVSLRVEGVNSNQFWRHEGDFGAKVQFCSGSHVQGGDFETVFLNNSGIVQSCTFYGHVEDLQRVNTNIIDGPGMKIHEDRSPLQLNLAHPTNFGDGSTWNGVAYFPGVDGNPDKSGSVTNTQYRPGDRIHTNGGIYEKQLDPSGDVKPFEKTTTHETDLSAVTLDATDDGDLWRHDGTATNFDADGTVTSNKGLYVWDDDANGGVGEFKTVATY